LVPALLMAGAGVNYRAADGKTALHFAAAHGVASLVTQLINAKVCYVVFVMLCWFVCGVDRCWVLMTFIGRCQC
jgi:hypothetical protein